MAQAQPRTNQSAPFVRFDLVEELRQLRQSPMQDGHVAKTLLHAPTLRIVLMALTRGTEVPTPHAVDALTIQAHEGRATVKVLDSAHELAPGQALMVEAGVPYTIVATEDCALVVTVAHCAACNS